MVKGNDVLALLKEGKKISEIAKQLKVSLNTIRYHKKKLIEAKLWHDDTEKFPLNFDEAMELLVEMIEKAKKVPILEATINQLENQKATLKNELDVIRKDLADRDDKKRRYNLAVQQGDIKKP